MAVLVEAISVVLRLEAVEARFAGGLDAFDAIVPNATGCSDGELIRFGFMVPADVEAFVKSLEGAGLRYLGDGMAQDMVVVDQQRGSLSACDWLDAGRVDLDPAGREQVTIAWLKGSEPGGFAAPDGWQYAGSLSQTFGFAPGTEAPRPGLQFLRHQDGIDVYLDRLSGKEVYVGRYDQPHPQNDGRRPEGTGG